MCFLLQVRYDPDLIFLFWVYLNHHNLVSGTKVTVNALHPGISDTEINRHLRWESTRYFTFPMRYLFLRHPYRAAQTTVYLAVSPEVEQVSGKYFRSGLIG